MHVILRKSTGEFFCGFQISRATNRPLVEAQFALPRPDLMLRVALIDINAVNDTIEDLAKQGHFVEMIEVGE